MTGEERSNGGSEPHAEVHGRAELSLGTVRTQDWWTCHKTRRCGTWSLNSSLHCLGEQQKSPNARNEGPNLAGRESCGGDGAA